VPPQDGFWLHHPKVLPPAARPDAAKPDPEDSILSTEAGLRVGAQRDLELVAEGEVLESDIPARSGGSNEGAKNQEKKSSIRQDSNAGRRGSRIGSTSAPLQPDHDNGKRRRRFDEGCNIGLTRASGKYRVLVLQTAKSSWIEPLVIELQRPAFQLAYMLLRDYSLAQEIVQEAFTRVWLSPRTPRELDNFRPWLYRTVINLARDHHRHESRWARLRLPRPLQADPVELAERHDTHAELATAIRSLRRREQEAIYVRFFEDLPYDEVARIIGGRQGAARVLVHRALRKLRDQLDTAESPEGFQP